MEVDAVKVAPSILAADFACLREQVARRQAVLQEKPIQ
jgi:pentose-5-phosphate-3-epimerase